jgi:sRNA-binding regulator protein Hfq
MLQSENLKVMLEELEAAKTKVKIYVVHGYARSGYIIEVREDCLLLEKNKNSERIDHIIPFHAISTVDVKH